MQSDHYARVRELFDQALDLPEAKRVAYVRAHAEDKSIADAVIRLLGYAEQAQIATQQPLQMLAESEQQALSAGRRMGKYVLFEVIGEGGMGQVYRARRVDDTEQWVALKVMRKSFFSRGSEDRFRAERQILARLSHPGIAHFIDTDVDADGNTYVVMELVQGQTLLNYANAQALNTTDRIKLFRQLLAAVIYAHRELIIHRDIKSANVMVRPDGVVKLLDFGIAKLLAEDGSLTGTRDRLYTPLSAAPEQIRGRTCGVVTDVYALGVLLYELIAGKPIFDSEGKTPGEFEHLALNVPPPDMRSRADNTERASSIPIDLERIVAKMLRKEPERRYQSVEQVDADLERLLSNQPVSVGDSGWFYRAQKFYARHRVASVFAVVSAIAVISALVATIHQNRTIRAERDRANLAVNAMKQAFVGADPSGETGGDVTAREILERSILALEPLVDQGEREVADLATILFEVQLSMNLIQDAEKTRALIDRAHVTGNTRICLLNARLLTEQQRLPEAAEALKHCHPQAQEDLILAKRVRARIALRNSNMLEALKQSTELSEMIDPSHPEWNAVQQEIAVVQTSLGQYDAAESIIEQAILTARKRLKPDHPDFAALQVAKLKILDAKGDHDAVYRVGQEAIDQLLPIYGERSAMIGRIYSFIGISLRNQGKHKDAIRYLKRAHRSFAAVFGPDHRNTLRMEMNLLLTTTESTSDAGDYRERYESLLVRSEAAGMNLFRQFVATEFAKWLGRRGDILTALRVLTSLATPPNQYDASDGRLNFDFQAWLTYTYWTAGCAVDPTDAYSREQACLLPPLRFDATCINARDALCDPTHRNTFGSLASMTKPKHSTKEITQ